MSAATHPFIRLLDQPPARHGPRPAQERFLTALAGPLGQRMSLDELRRLLGLECESLVKWLLTRCFRERLERALRSLDPSTLPGHCAVVVMLQLARDARWRRRVGNFSAHRMSRWRMPTDTDPERLRRLMRRGAS